jgi:hypothetical protein
MSNYVLWRHFQGINIQYSHTCPCLVPASLCKKTVMRIWRVYIKYCSGERWRRGSPSRVACLPEYFMYCNYLKRLGTRQIHALWLISPDNLILTEQQSHFQKKTRILCMKEVYMDLNWCFLRWGKFVIKFWSFQGAIIRVVTCRRYANREVQIWLDH